MSADIAVWLVQAVIAVGVGLTAFVLIALGWWARDRAARVRASRRRHGRSS